MSTKPFAEPTNQTHKLPLSHFLPGCLHKCGGRPACLQTASKYIYIKNPLCACKPATHVGVASIFYWATHDGARAVKHITIYWQKQIPCACTAVVRDSTPAELMADSVYHWSYCGKESCKQSKKNEAMQAGCHTEIIHASLDTSYATTWRTLFCCRCGAPTYESRSRRAEPPSGFLCKLWNDEHKPHVWNLTSATAAGYWEGDGGGAWPWPLTLKSIHSRCGSPVEGWTSEWVDAYSANCIRRGLHGNREGEQPLQSAPRGCRRHAFITQVWA